MRTPRRLAATMATFAAAALMLPATAGSQGGPSVVRIPFPREDGSLTPYTFRLGYPLVSLIYDTLMLRDDGGVPRPWLARSVRRGGLRLTIQLRRGVRWQDGRPLTSDDVVFTFGHVASRRNPRFTPQVRDVAGVQATGPYTVVITLRRPSLGFLDQPLADMPILPAHLWRNLPPSRLAPSGPPIGSGPYRLVGHRKGKSYRFEANRRYFRGAPAVDEIRVPIIRKAQATFDALRAHRVDAIPVSLPRGSNRGLEGLGLRVADGTDYLGAVLMFNLRMAPFNRLSVRRALAKAIDVKRIARVLGGGSSDSTSQPLPADHGYLHPASRWTTAQDLHRFDPGAARVAIAEAAIPPLTILVPKDDPVREEIGRQVVLALGRVGILSRTFRLTPDQLNAAVGQDGSTPRFGMAIWNAEPLASYDPSFLQAVFGARPGAPRNYSGYRSAEFDRLADRVAAAPTTSARRRAVTAEQRLLAHDLPVVPLVFPAGVYAFRPTAYAGWTYLQGTGIFNKRSFVGRHEAAAPAAAATPIGDPVDRQGGDDGPPLLPLVLGAAGILALVALGRLLTGSGAGRR